MKKTFFPEEFIEKYSKFCKSEWKEFFETIRKKQPKSVWINTKKTHPDLIYKKLEEKNIFFKKYSFSEQGFETNLEKPGNLEEFKKGIISLQEKAAMLPVIALKINKYDVVLDACSAPGMKTIQASNFAKKVIAVDVNTERTKSLLHNKGKYALNNVIVKRMDVRNLKDKFDKIILDTPCSSEGLIRKKRGALKNWSQELVERKAIIQKELLSHCFELLKNGGELVYSTCSFSPEENEEVVLHLLKNKKNAIVEKIELEGIKIRENKLCENCVRLWPQDNNTQQFFIAKIKKL
jgi:tRNA (cytosine49-C5)-methyltransferase